jgi:hypothetical protein
MTTFPSGVTATLISHNCQPIGFRPFDHALLYNSQNANGYWDLYADGVSLTSSAPIVWTHRGGSDQRDSQVLLVAARSQLYSSAPGQGAVNDVHLLDLDAQTVTPLVTGRKGVIWARWHPTLDRICWAEQVATSTVSQPFGTQQIHVADVTETGILNEYVHSNLAVGFHETYGWLDADTLMFASDAGQSSWLQTTLHSMPDVPGANSVLLHSLNGYHEFAFVPPVGMFNDEVESILMGWCSGTLGLELWRLLLDGNQTVSRITYFNPGFGLGIGGMCFDPENPKQASIGLKTTAAGAIDGYLLDFTNYHA